MNIIKILRKNMPKKSISQAKQETQPSKFIIGIGILSLMVVMGTSIYALGIGAASAALLGTNMLAMSTAILGCLGILTVWLGMSDGALKTGVTITATATLTDLAIGTVLSTWPAIGPVAMIIAAVLTLTIGAVYKGKASSTSELKKALTQVVPNASDLSPQSTTSFKAPDQQQNPQDNEDQASQQKSNDTNSLTH
jgi:hypothetical protein